jgi:hypothetical protein
VKAAELSLKPWTSRLFEAHLSFHRIPCGAGWRDQVLRESFNPLAMARAQLLHGVADIGPPGDEVYSF